MAPGAMTVARRTCMSLGRIDVGAQGAIELPVRHQVLQAFGIGHLADVP